MQTFKLGSEIDPKDVDATLLRTRKHESVSGAYTYEFKIEGSAVEMTAYKGALQEITYELTGLFPWTKKRKRLSLLESYGVDDTWTQIFDNKAGCLVHDPNEVCYATWNLKSNYISFGILFFREEIQRVVN